MKPINQNRLFLLLILLLPATAFASTLSTSEHYVNNQLVINGQSLTLTNPGFEYKVTLYNWSTSGTGYGYGSENTVQNPLQCDFNSTFIKAGTYTARLKINGHYVGTPFSIQVNTPLDENTPYEPLSGLTAIFTDLPDGNYYLEVDTNTSPPSNGSYSFAGKSYNIHSNLTNGTFSVTLRLDYDDSDNDGIVDETSIDETTLKLYYFNGTDWIEIPGASINTTDNYVTATLDHFSTYGLFGAQKTTSNPNTNNQQYGSIGGWGPGLNNTNNLLPPDTNTPEPINETPDENTLIENNDTNEPITQETFTDTNPQTNNPNPLTGLSVGLTNQSAGIGLLILAVLITFFSIQKHKTTPKTKGRKP